MPRRDIVTIAGSAGSVQALEQLIPSIPTDLEAAIFVVIHTPPRARSARQEGDERFSGFTCPECRGPLYVSEHGGPEFRCRVGHVLSLNTLLGEHTSTQERKLYEALVALEEGADLARIDCRSAGRRRKNGPRSRSRPTAPRRGYDPATHGRVADYVDFLKTPASKTGTMQNWHYKGRRHQ